VNEWRQGEYVITTDPTRVDLDVVHGFLTTSYWAAGIPREVVKRSIEHALNFSVWHEPPDGAPAQVGFARVVTDFATFGYVGDVFVLGPHRGRGLSKWLMRVIVEHPDLQGFRRWCLLTRDAHGLYAGAGFKPLAAPDRWMERWTPNAYAPR
jgi:GNAT superfamily N-acetyltransferase